MRFSGDAYDKLYPRKEEATPVVESAVETFKPTETETEMNEEATVPKETTETTENTETQESQEEGE